jgi:predicted PurR-regulated permease PerM
MTLEERQPDAQRTRRVAIEPPLATVDRRAFRALLYLSLIAVGLVVVFFTAQLVSIFSDILGIFFLAWLLAFLVDPIASRLVRSVRWMPRHVAVLVVYGLLFAILIAVLLLVSAALASSISDLSRSLPQLREQLPAILAPVQQWVNELGFDRLDVAQGSVDLLDQFSRSTDAWLEPIRDAAVASVAAIGTFSLIVFLSLYMAADGAQLRDSFLRLIPARFASDIALLETSVARSFGGFVRGQVVLGLVYGLYAAVVSAVLGLPYLPVIAVSVGILHAIPFFGPFVSWIPPVLIAVLYEPDAILPAVALMAVGMLITMNILQPRIVGQSVGLHPIVVLASVLIGARLYGALGAIFSVPVAAVIAATIGHWTRGRLAPERSAAAVLPPRDRAERAAAGEESADGATKTRRSRIRRGVQEGGSAAH